MSVVRRVISTLTLIQEISSVSIRMKARQSSMVRLRMKAENEGYKNSVLPSAPRSAAQDRPWLLRDWRARAVVNIGRTCSLPTSM